MINKIDLATAIAAHGAWKTRLTKAVDTGQSEFQSEKVSLDNMCDFGKWLYGMSPAEKAAPIWTQVQAMHARFHQEAGRILALAVRGAIVEARTALAPGGDFSQLSGQMVILLTRWQKELGG